MATKQAYLQFILDQLSELEEVSYRAMMGEFLLYYRRRLIGGLYDDRLLVKPVPAAKALLPGARACAPYPGAKALLEVDAVDDRAFLVRLVRAMHDELPAPKRKS